MVEVSGVGGFMAFRYNVPPSRTVGFNFSGFYR